MVQVLAGGSGSKEGLGDITSIDGEPDPIWSEDEQHAFETELVDLERKIRAAPVAGKILWREVAFTYRESDGMPMIDKGPFKRLGSLALSLN